MGSSFDKGRKEEVPAKKSKHPYLSGNFAPIPSTSTHNSVRCSYTGTIPRELYGGQYVRNGSNPINITPGKTHQQDYHWFDGDGMLAGVHFKYDQPDGVTPRFTSQFILTDVAVTSLNDDAAKEDENQRDGGEWRVQRKQMSWAKLFLVLGWGRKYKESLLPSLATLVDPRAWLLIVLWKIMRSVVLVFLTWLPGSTGEFGGGLKIRRISVANTGIYFHDGRALATCESGPPMRIGLPSLRTIGWYTGYGVEGEGHQWDGRHYIEDHECRNQCRRDKYSECHGKCKERPMEDFGGKGALSWMREWTTGHPKIDPTTQEMIVFHNTFVPPYVHVSVISPGRYAGTPFLLPTKTNMPVPGCSGGRMRHDFGVSLGHTVILDLPLTLTPFNLLKNKPMVEYTPEKPARFGVFPRREPQHIKWFEAEGCCIFHTANTWDEYDPHGNAIAVNMLACRMTSASLVYSAGNIAPPTTHPKEKRRAETDSLLPSYSLDTKSSTEEEEQCRLYYYRFSLCSSHSPAATYPLTSQPPLSHWPPTSKSASPEAPPAPFHSTTTNTISNHYALSPIPFEFPVLNPEYNMSCAQYIYGCSTTSHSFTSALGGGTKIDVLVKINVARLIMQAEETNMSSSTTSCVDTRSMSQILASQDQDDTIKAFKLPALHYAQEARFVPRSNPDSEDDGYLLFYVFDEGQLNAAGECPSFATSELWILDARSMTDVIGKVRLPTRVPYGLHGNWFPQSEVDNQRSLVRYRELGHYNWNRSVDEGEDIWNNKYGGVGDGRSSVRRVIDRSKEMRDIMAQAKQVKNGMKEG